MGLPRLAFTGAPRGSPTNMLLSQLTYCFLKIHLLRRHAKTVRDGASSNKIDYVNKFEEILNIEEH